VHTSTPPPIPPSPVMTGLGQALRWLRERQARKQYQVANDAGITKGMLSAYETGRQRPSLETLDKLLETLGCDLNDLHNALQIVNGRPERMKGWRLLDSAGAASAPGATTGPPQGPPGAPGAPRGPGASATSSASAASAGAEAWRAERSAGGSGHGLHESGRFAYRSQIQAAGHLPSIPSLPHFPGGPGGHIGWAPRGLPLADEIRETTGTSAASEIYRVLGLLGPGQAPVAQLPPEEEQALAQMLEGFHNLLRYWHRCLTLAVEAARAAQSTEPAATAATGITSPGPGDPAPAGTSGGSPDGE
jgi:transcriptional regulator with XRE-family HTH domain